ncbi:MAG: FtsW/RodA/SpoVE family cell cycle protein [Bacteroidaceae bacterium]|jgi:cell division protein FtsW|nr:FtsW/RodA/SpoVE family cell cycle protein [Bacteroidaceae bacterium]MCR5043004.1 FtsW/RodA/SpoVE family cell cycle protein [Bacteroidaceae bacterium]MDO4200724.1 FtsW/RodA/SpoVE family cell cycle protein [Bacteroidales bacterium]
MGKFVNALFGGSLFKGDKGVWMIYFFLCMISLVEVYSASSRLTFEGGHHWAPMVSQAGFLLFGFLIILFVHRIPCKWFMLLPFVLLPVAILLLLMAVLGGGEINGTNRWLSIGSVSFQPSEVAKAALLMTAAMVLAKTQAEREEYVRGKKRKVVGAIKGKRYLAFAIVGGAALLICGLIILDNVSTALMLFTVVIVMMFIGQVPNDLMFKGLAVIVGVGAFFVLMVMAVPEDTWNSLPGCKRVVTVKHRIERKFNIGDGKDRKKTGKSEMDILLNDENSQTTYASIAIANSDVIGLGPGNSIQRDFLQHAESDFIYAIIVEEMGVMGAFFVAFLYLALLIRVGRIAQKCTSFFPAYLVLGFGIMMVMQAFVNMSVAVGLVPVTGQTLPLISKGGTSILITSFYIGVILSVSRYAEKKEMKAPLVEAVPEGETSEYYTDGAMS